MALASTRISIISRKEGHSSVAAAAYRAGDKIKDERTGEIHNYSRKRGVIYSEILTPDYAPDWMRDRGQLWNGNEYTEKRKDAQVARSLYFALPKEFSREQNIELVREIAQRFTQQGMVTDVSIHHHQGGNPHAHLLLTTRNIDHDHFGNKNRAWNDRDNAKLWREQIAISTNKYLEMYGHDQRIDMRSYEEQGIDRLPTVHLGSHAHRLEQKGIQTERGNINRAIESKNQQLEAVNRELSELGKVREQEQTGVKELIAGQGKKKEDQPLSYAEKYKQATERYRKREQQPDRKPSYENLYKQPDQPKPQQPPDQNLSYAERYKQANQRRLVRDPDRQPPRQYRYQEQLQPTHHRAIEHKERSYEDLYKQTDGQTNQAQTPNRKPSYEDLYKQPDQPKPQQPPDQNLSYAERYKQRADEVKRYHERIKRNKGKNKDDGYSRDR